MAKISIPNKLDFLLLGFASFIITIILLRNYNLASSFFSLFYGVPYYDKIGHFALMGILTFLAVLAIAPRLKKYSKLKSTTIVAAIVFTIILIEECSQLLISTRTFSLIDLICDLFGVVVFSCFGYFLIAKK